jgi:hypothetical protein
MNIKKLTPRLLLLSMMALSSAAVYAQDIRVIVSPHQTPEERVRDEEKLKDLRKAAEDKRAAEDAARIAETSPKNLLSKAKIVFICSHTTFFETVQLQNELRKRVEFDQWQMAIVDSSKLNAADILIEIDRPLFTYRFTYVVTSRSSGIVLASGKITAFDGDVAAPKLASRIMDDIRSARGEPKVKK